jgi:hypothetical protein
MAVSQQWHRPHVHSEQQGLTSLSTAYQSVQTAKLSASDAMLSVSQSVYRVMAL